MRQPESKLLMNEMPLVVLPNVAAVIGLNEAIILQQLHFWLHKSQHVKEGRRWIYNTIDQWKEQFPFFSPNTIRRTLQKMEKAGWIDTGNFNKKSYDKTKWYTINYDRLPKMGSGVLNTEHPKWATRCTQNGQLDVPNLGKPIPETTIDNTESRLEGKKTPSPNDASKDHQGTPSPVTLFKAWWASEYKERFGHEYLFSHEKDGRLIKQMLGACDNDLEVMKHAARVFLSTEDEFTNKAGHSIGVMRSQFNRLVARGSPDGDSQPTFAQRFYQGQPA